MKCRVLYEKTSNGYDISSLLRKTIVHHLSFASSADLVILRNAILQGRKGKHGLAMRMLRRVYLAFSSGILAESGEQASDRLKIRMLGLLVRLEISYPRCQRRSLR